MPNNGVVTVEAVADRLHVALVALRRVLVVTVIQRPDDAVIAVHVGVAMQLVGGRRGIRIVPVSGYELLQLAPVRQRGPVRALRRAPS
jgi:hypothetical protein